jgi:hypothetical protein
MTEFYIASKSNASAPYFILRLENENIDPIINAIKIILNIEKTEMVKNAFNSFARSIPHHCYVMFGVSVEHDILSLLTKGCMFGFVPDVYGEEGFLCLNSIMTWNTNHEKKSCGDLTTYFNLEEVIQLENLEDVSSTATGILKSPRNLNHVPIVFA